jgi:hypothetical protein
MLPEDLRWDEDNEWDREPEWGAGEDEAMDAEL